MKSFAAAASMAALSSAAAVKSISDMRQEFSDAFIASFTGTTDARTVDTCFTSEQLLDQTLQATALIKVTDYMRGYHRLYKIWNESPKSQTACANRK
jgi:hypothetical protein|mmetsp:Transcript_9169/g.12493  ORF Transcript_9169/g.12493 Transcript_9169/m.12493 type:complete len:97 (-) Transcript_9169:471-761(-)